MNRITLPPLEGKLSKYSPDICPIIVKLMRQGLTPVQVCANEQLMISKKNLDSWLMDFDKPELREAIELGLTLCEAYWEQKGQLGILGELETFREATYKAFMQHHFKRSDKTDTTVNSKEMLKSLSDSELDEKLKSLGYIKE